MTGMQERVRRKERTEYIQSNKEREDTRDTSESVNDGRELITLTTSGRSENEGIAY